MANKTFSKTGIICSLVILLNFLIVSTLKSHPEMVVKTLGRYKIEASHISQNINNIMAFVNSNQKEDIACLSSISTGPALKKIQAILDQNSVRFEKTSYSKKLILLVGKGFRVRDVEITKDVGERNTTDYLIFDFDHQCCLTDVRWSLYGAFIDYRNIDPIVSSIIQGELKTTIENIRSYYNNRELKKIEAIYSTNASIVVGRNVELLGRNKELYISKLYEIFNKGINKYIHVKFEEIKFYKKVNFPETFIVEIIQSWETSTYNDSGRVKLVLNIQDRNHPKIHARIFDADVNSIRKIDEIIKKNYPYIN